VVGVSASCPVTQQFNYCFILAFGSTAHTIASYLVKLNMLPPSTSTAQCRVTVTIAIKDVVRVTAANSNLMTDCHTNSNPTDPTKQHDTISVSVLISWLCW